MGQIPGKLQVATATGDWQATAGKGLDVTPENVGRLLDAVRYLRTMSVNAGAEYYGVFLQSRTPARPGMVLCCDRKFPRASAISQTICGPHGVDWLAANEQIATPIWWRYPGEAAQCPAFPLLALAAESTPLTPGVPGLALPVFAEGGARGFVVLAGSQIAVDDASMCDLHIRSFKLFASVSHMLLTQTGEVPVMSLRELQCLKLAAQGKTSEDIAGTLGLSIHTANQYLWETMQKLNAMNRMHAVAKALRLGLID